MKNYSNLNSESPCINECKLEKNVCTGCGRTLEEIKGWCNMTIFEKHFVNARLKKKNETTTSDNPQQSIPHRSREV